MARPRNWRRTRLTRADGSPIPDDWTLEDENGQPLALQLRFRGNSDSLGFHDSAWGSWDDGSFHRDNA